MLWQKAGHIYVPDGSLWWARSYAHLPTILVMDDVVRVYYAGLDDEKFGRIGFVDLNPQNLSEVVYIHPEPVLDLGALGSFDDSGVNPSSIIRVDNKIYLYYIGWQRCERVPYLLQAGLAFSEDGVNFTRASQATILPRFRDEPFFRSAMTVLKVDDQYEAWYPSALRWEIIHESLYPVYEVRHVTSPDGVIWQNDPIVSIPLLGDEFGIGRPFVRYVEGLYQMWYSIRSRSAPYRMGYAESTDGRHWVRRDDLIGIEASEAGWDSEMICYGVIHKIHGQDVMFYNGNQHGRSGFGYAINQS